MFASSQISILTVAIVLATSQPLFAQGFSQSENRTESAPVFRVQEVLSDEIIQGPGYFMALDVPVRENKYLFTIRTAYGTVATFRDGAWAGV